MAMIIQHAMAVASAIIFMYADIAHAHTLALQYLINQKNVSACDIFNLGSGNGVSVLEAIHAFEKISGKKLNYKIGERRPGDVVAIYANNDLAVNRIKLANKI